MPKQRTTKGEKELEQKGAPAAKFNAEATHGGKISQHRRNFVVPGVKIHDKALHKAISKVTVVTHDKEGFKFTKVDAASLLGLKGKEVSELVSHIEKGLGYGSMEHFIRNASLPREDAIDFVRISPRTLVRRREKGRLSPDESDRLVRAARITSQTQRLFEGDKKAANRWLKTPQPALGGATPIEYARTEIGAREVEALIGRLEHGIFS